MGEFRFTKWGGKKHWRFPLSKIGSDEYGEWFGTRQGVQLQRGDEPPVTQPHDFVTLVPPPGAWWTANFNADSADKLELYIDITTPAALVGDDVEAVDLDLDVVRTRDGRVVLLDEDEFEEHQVLYAYPEDVILSAKSAAEWLMAAVSAGEEPFGQVGKAWVARYASSGES